MEKENKKARDDARKEYNETVRSLALFLRRRDPRYQKAQKEQNQIAQEKAAQASKARAANAQTNEPVNFVEQEWQKVDGQSKEHADLDWGGHVEGGDEEWECVACGKSFRSEAAWDSHERSKKHLKAIEALRKEMEMEDEALELNEEGGVDEPPLSDDEGEEDAADEVEEEDEEGEEEEVRTSWECEACEKKFNSQIAWDSHERNKKHLKAVERLRQEARSKPPSRKPSAPASEIPSPTPTPAPEPASSVPEIPDEEPFPQPKSQRKAKRTPQPVMEDEDLRMPLSRTERRAVRLAQLEDDDSGTGQEKKKKSRRKDKASTSASASAMATPAGGSDGEAEAGPAAEIVSAQPSAAPTGAAANSVCGAARLD